MPENMQNQSPTRGQRVPLSLMDTTLRDGEQTHGVSITGEEKLMIARYLLEEVRVDRVEVASCRVSQGEQKSLARIMEWANSHGYGDSVEVLSFVDHKASVDWLKEAGCRRMNVLTKGSRHHCEGQLRKSLPEHLADIEQTLRYAVDNGVTAMIYLEDWSNGMITSPDYVFEMLDSITRWPFDRIHLCDTLGILAPFQVEDFVGPILSKYPDAKFEFHGHNDYGLATANTLTAARLGVAGAHVTVNGLGERAGNTPLAELAACLNDHSERAVRIDEAKLKEASRLVQAFSGKRIGANAPIVGIDVFTQTAGIHADGDKKGNLYESKLTPKRFGRDRVYALGKLSGRSNLDFNLAKLNLDLTADQRKAVLERIIDLGDKKKTVTTEDLPFLISDLLSSIAEKKFEVIECILTSTINMKPAANIQVRYEGKTYHSLAYGNGGYDAFMNALRKIAPEMRIRIPHLSDFEIHIPPGGHSDALVEATISWDTGMKTRAVSSDQVMAAIIATERVINLMTQKNLGHMAPDAPSVVVCATEPAETEA